jgi:segregation and condensation protein B
LLSVLETVLFVSGEPIKKDKLAKIAEVKMEDVDLALGQLIKRYSQTSSGFMLLTKGDEIQLVSKSENSQYVERLVKNELQDSLSNAAAEVVSIIAYKGPISKTEIEAIRGVNCAYTLRNLLLRGLIEKNGGLRDNRSHAYSISFDFLKKMGISDVKKLPEYDILSTDKRIDMIK